MNNNKNESNPNKDEKNEDFSPRVKAGLVVGAAALAGVIGSQAHNFIDSAPAPQTSHERHLSAEDMRRLHDESGHARVYFKPDVSDYSGVVTFSAKRLEQQSDGSYRLDSNTTPDDEPTIGNSWSNADTMAEVNGEYGYIATGHNTDTIAIYGQRNDGTPAELMGAYTTQGETDMTPIDPDLVPHVIG